MALIPKTTCVLECLLDRVHPEACLFGIMQDSEMGGHNRGEKRIKGIDQVCGGDTAATPRAAMVFMPSQAGTASAATSPLRAASSFRRAMMPGSRAAIVAWPPS